MDYRPTLTLTIAEDVVIRLDHLTAVLPAEQAAPLVKLLLTLERKVMDDAARNIVVRKALPAPEEVEEYVPKRAVIAEPNGHGEPPEPETTLRLGSHEMEVLRLCSELPEPFTSQQLALKAEMKEVPAARAINFPGRLNTLAKKGVIHRVGGRGTKQSPYQYRFTETGTALLLPHL